MLFDLTGKVALLIGHEGNLGPIWKETMTMMGATVYTAGLPDQDFSSDSWNTARILYSRIVCPEVPDILVCNAAIDTPPTKTSARFFSDFEKILKVNVSAHAKICDAFIPLMVERGHGIIVFIGSIQGYIGADWRNYSGGFEKPCAYNASKAALQQLARSITVQYGRFGIRAVCPGFGPYISGKLPKEFLNKIVDKIPMKRTVSKQSLQQTLLYAICCEDLAGEDWLVDGGYTKW